MTYQVQHNPRSKSIKIKITAQAEVVVVAPRDCPTFFIDRFVKQHQDWIDEHVAQARAARPNTLQHPDQILLFGKTYHKKIGERDQYDVGVRAVGTDLIITPVTNSPTSIDKSLQAFLKSTAEKYITPRVHVLAKKMNVTFHNLSFKNQKTRWGSCSSEGNLNFNWKLVHSPPEVIDYVLIHELAHRTEMNHSAAFWEIVQRFDPEYSKHRGWLKRQGMDLG